MLKLNSCSNGFDISLCNLLQSWSKSPPDLDSDEAFWSLEESVAPHRNPQRKVLQFVSCPHVTSIASFIAIVVNSKSHIYVVCVLAPLARIITILLMTHQFLHEWEPRKKKARSKLHPLSWTHRARSGSPLTFSNTLVSAKWRTPNLDQFANTQVSTSSLMNPMYCRSNLPSTLNSLKTLDPSYVSQLV